MLNRPRTLNSGAKDFTEAAPRFFGGALPLLILVNADLDAVLISECCEDATNLAKLVDINTRRLPGAVRRDCARSHRLFGHRSIRGTPRSAPSRLLFHQHATKLYGEREPLTAVMVESCGDRDPFARSARLYALSPRETEVLSLVLEGAPAGEIAGALNIAEGTVQGYLGRTLSKTRSRNRIAMVAKVLGWDSLQEA